jgi:hypothetical protein
MSVSDRLGLPLLTEAMANKAAAVNLSLGEMAKVISAKLTVQWVTISGVAPPTCYIPYNDDNDLSDRSALRCIYMEVTGSVYDSVGFGYGNLLHPNKEHFFFCQNKTNKRLNIKVDTDLGGSVSILAGKAKMVYTTGDGSIIDVTELLGLDATATSNDFTLSYFGQPEIGETMAKWMAGRETVIPIDMEGAVGRTGWSDTTYGSSGSFLIYHNSTRIGRVSVLTLGGVAVNSELSADLIVAPTDMLSLVYSSANAATSWRDLYLNIPGRSGLALIDE